MSEEEYESYDSDTDGDEEVSEVKADGDEKVSESKLQKREHHNMLERKRRENLKDGFRQLKNALPCYKKKRNQWASRVQILNNTIGFFRKMEKKIKKINEENEILAEENRILAAARAEYDAAVENEDWDTADRIMAMDLPLAPRPYLLDDCATEESESESSVEDGSSPDYPPVDSDSSSREKNGTEDADSPSREENESLTEVENEDWDTVDTGILAIDLPLTPRPYLLEGEGFETEENESLTEDYSFPDTPPVVAGKKRKRR